MRWINSPQRIQRSAYWFPGSLPHPLALLIIVMIGFGATNPHSGFSHALQVVTEPAPVTLRFVSWKPDHPRVWDEVLAEFTKAHP
ncbi:MAG: hypothetical protein GDA68_21220, partial [Nitrospira sp. CR2.1]|nr:hypothetical protein [Nitrospira sp. CR2.1]